MPITIASLISRRNFTLAGAHDSVLVDTLTLGTNLFMYKNNNVHKMGTEETREGFLRKNIVAVSFFQNCAIHPYSYNTYLVH